MSAFPRFGANSMQSFFFRYPGLSVLVYMFAVNYFPSSICLVGATETLQSPSKASFWNNTSNVSKGPFVVNYTSTAYSRRSPLGEAISKSSEVILNLKDAVGAPGVVVGVSVNGKNVWTQGFGLSDLENRVPCTSNTVMRIASVSKSVTMAVVAKLWEEGRLDLDVPVQDYVPDFPRKEVDGVPVNITCRHLVSHLSGIRHYEKKNDLLKNTTDPDLQDEFLITKRFKTVTDSLQVFENDELFFKPGEQYLYTTYGYVLLSAVVEKVTGKTFQDTMMQMFRQFGMTESCFEFHENLVYNRAHHYMRSTNGFLENAPYVDNSYKWAGGGYLSTVGDMLKFGNVMLYSFQHNSNSRGLPGYLKRETVKQMWTPTPQSIEATKGEVHYGMGWVLCHQEHQVGGGQAGRFCATHSGGAVGGTSIIYILPPNEDAQAASRGVVVTIITNIEGVDLNKAALQIALLFERSNSALRKSVV